jgi:AcrR family transcriptional regulator
MLALLERKPLDQITILEITEQAGVHRATFFRHYQSREALLEHVAADQIRQLVELTLPILENEDNLASVRALLAFVGRHRRVWSALLAGAGGVMRDTLLRYSTEIAKHKVENAQSSAVGLTIRYSVGLIFESISWWLSQADLNESEAELAIALHNVLMSVQEISDRWGEPRQNHRA